MTEVKGEGRALIVVDVQRDFCPGGALPVARGDEVVKPLNNMTRLFGEEGSPVIFTRDWHPRNHCSFREFGGIWPPHCIQHTRGAEFHQALRVPKKSIIINKATNPKRDAYSGFQGTELVEILMEGGVAEVFVGGLATDYCVKNTAIDALKNNFITHILTDCIRGVNVRPADSAAALREMVSGGARKITSEALAKRFGRRVAVLSSS